MALTYKKLDPCLDEATLDVTLDNSYPTSGEDFTAADVGFTELKEVIVHGPFRNGANAVLPVWDPATSKLFVYWGNAGTASILPEVTNTTSLASYTGRVTVRGRR
jgi:hypothetical protein